ncbi:MAG: DUF1501 domain-containing protein [Chloroflexi bacterium]|nr:MAG: DUF1501 domain-containing protein [Chloroflexota bacterium]
MTRGVESVNVRVDEPVEVARQLAAPLSRRGFVSRGIALVGLGSVLPAAFVRAVFAEGTPPGVTSKRRALVVVQLGGGNDGLNTLVPYTDGAYYDARPRLAVKPETALHLSPTIGLHPEMTGLKALYDSGQVGIVQGVGYPNPNRSHFRSMEIWHTASMAEHTSTGWLGRLLDATRFEQKQAWRAVNIGSALAESLTSQASFVPALTSIPTYTLNTDPRARGQGDRRVTDWVRLFAQQAAYGGALAMVSETGTKAYQSTVDLRREIGSYQPLANYPGTALATALRTSAELITSNLGTGICYVSTGGFDSHSGQDNTQPALLRAVSEAVSAFYADLAARGMDQDVLTVMWTEFGRRVKENGSTGTDHGTATPLFVIGGGVTGGLYGETPSLRNLDGNGDLKHSTDFRSVYATVLEQWFATDPKDVLGGSFPALPLFA